MQLEAERAAAELRRINAEAEKLEAEARKLAPEATKLEAESDKLHAGARRIRRATVKDAWMIGLAVFAAGVAALQLADSVGWL